MDLSQRESEMYILRAILGILHVTILFFFRQLNEVTA